MCLTLCCCLLLNANAKNSENESATFDFCSDCEFEMFGLCPNPTDKRDRFGNCYNPDEDVVDFYK